jgi:hypothetical protein
MARGKHANRAALRREDNETAATLSTYQHRVAKLTAENREFRERLTAQERSASQTARRLRAERDEGVAPQVEAMRLTLQAEREKHTERLRAVAKCVGDMIEANGWAPHADEWKRLAALLGSVPELISLGGNANRDARRTGPKRVRHVLELQTSGQLDGKSGPASGHGLKADG